MDRFLPFEHRASFKQLLLKFSVEVIVIVLMGIFAILVLKTIFPRFMTFLTSGLLLCLVFLAATFLFTRNNFPYIGISKDYFIYARILGNPIQIPLRQITSVSGRGNNDVRLEYSDRHLLVPLNTLPKRKQVIFEYLISHNMPRNSLPAPVQTRLSIVEIYEDKIKAGKLTIDDISITTNNRKLAIKRIVLALCAIAISSSILLTTISIGRESYAGAAIAGVFFLLVFAFFWRYWTAKSIIIDENQILFKIGKKKTYAFDWHNIEVVSIPSHPYIQIWTKETSTKISYRHFSIPDVEKMIDSFQKRAIFNDIPIG